MKWSIEVIWQRSIEKTRIIFGQIDSFKNMTEKKLYPFFVSQEEDVDLDEATDEDLEKDDNDEDIDTDEAIEEDIEE